MNAKEISLLLARRFNLTQELETIDRQIKEAQQRAYRVASEKDQTSKIVLERFFEGQHVIYSCFRYWWVNSAGDLLSVLDVNECDAIKAMTEQGILKHEI